MKYNDWRNWEHRCETCKHYKDGKCVLIDRAVGKMDWCKDYTR